MKNSKYILFVLLAAITMLGISCEEEEGPKVSITSESLEAVYQGESVTLQGNNFANVQFVFLAYDQVPFELEGDQLTFEVPINATPGMNTITLAMAGDARVSAELEVLLLPIPIINSISPSAAPAGADVTIRGSALMNADAVTVGGTEATIVSKSESELVFTVPDGLPNNTPADISLTSATGDIDSPSIFYVGQNLLANGGFEQGDDPNFTNWNKFNGADLLTPTTAEDEAYHGRSLRAVGFGGDAWRTQLASDAAATSVGVEYTLFMWIKAEAGSPGDGGNIRFSTTPSAQYSANYDITSEWQQIEWVFTANEPATQIVLDLGVIEDAVYFVDNVTLVETGDAAPQPVELLSNGGFENGSGDDFENWTKANGADLMTATTNGAEVYDGSRALRAVGFGSDHWRTQLISEAVTTEVDVEYTASFWIRAEEGSPGDGGVVRMSTQGNGSAQYQGDVTVTTEWQQITWSFTANGTETNLVLDLGATLDAVYFIDEVSLLAPPE